MKDLPRVATRQCGDRESNLRPVDCKFSVLTATLPSRTIINYQNARIMLLTVNVMIIEALNSSETDICVLCSQSDAPQLINAANLHSCTIIHLLLITATSKDKITTFEYIMTTANPFMANFHDNLRPDGTRNENKALHHWIRFCTTMKVGYRQGREPFTSLPKTK